MVDGAAARATTAGSTWTVWRLREADGAQTQVEQLHRLAVEGCGVDAVAGADELVHRRGRGVQQLRRDSAELVDHLGDKRARARAGRASLPAVGDADVDVGLVAGDEALPALEPGEAAEGLVLGRGEVLRGAGDDALAEEVVDDDRLQEAVGVAVVLERRDVVLEPFEERVGDEVEVAVDELADGVDAAVDAEDLLVDA